MLASMILAGTVLSVGAQPAPDKPQRGRLEGTWELIADGTATVRHVKIINATHFVWITYQRSDGTPILVGGGTYRFDSKTYTEKYEFAGPGPLAELVSKGQTYSAEVDGAHWTHTGTLTNGVSIRQSWRKLK
jgi:hypothetical protein